MAGEKFTPGPWRVDEVKTFGAYGVWTGYPAQPGHDGAGYPKQVCSMFSQCFRQVDGGTRPERDANARLIAAAPDLYAALSEVLPLAVARLVELRLLPPDQRPVDHPKLAAAFVALKKARGEVQGVG
jgi:hypothetical protein